MLEGVATWIHAKGLVSLCKRLYTGHSFDDSGVGGGEVPPAIAFCRMLMAALMAASMLFPQLGHSYRLRPCADESATPHSEHVTLVWCESTLTNSRPAHSALYASCACSKLQVCSCTGLRRPTAGTRSPTAISPKRLTISVVRRWHSLRLRTRSRCCWLARTVRLSRHLLLPSVHCNSRRRARSKLTEGLRLLSTRSPVDSAIRSDAPMSTPTLSKDGVKGSRSTLVGEVDEYTSSTLGYRQGPDLPRIWKGGFTAESQRRQALYPDAARRNHPTSRFRQLNGLPTTIGLEPWVARRFAQVDPAIERLSRPVEAPQNAASHLD